MICGNCKKMIDYDSVFCKYCGTKQEGIFSQDIETDEENVESTLTAVLNGFKVFGKVTSCSDSQKDDLRRLIRKYGSEIIMNVLPNAINEVMKNKKDNDNLHIILLISEIDYRAKYEFENSYLPYMKEVWKIIEEIYGYSYDSKKGKIVKYLKSILGYFYKSDAYAKVYEKLKEKAKKCNSTEFFDHIDIYALENNITIIEE